MTSENKELSLEDIEHEGNLDFDELERKLESEIDLQLSDLELLKNEREQIGDESNLGEVIKGVVWEQFMNQIAAKAGADFIAENNGLTLDLRKDAHIQTTENFANGKIATHNTKINYQARYDTFQDSFEKNANGEIRTKYDKRTGTQKNVLRQDNKKEKINGVRKEFDKGRDKGSKSIHKDHTVSVGEIVRDAEMNAHLSREEQINFANSDKNLKDLDSAANQSKGDSSMKDWLDSEHDGQKPDERFNINKEEKLEEDRIAREEKEKRLKEGKQESLEAGNQSRKEEAFKIGDKALRAAIMLLFAELTKEVISKLIKWLQSSKKNIQTLMGSIKEAIQSFISKLKTHLKNASNTMLNTILSAIYGPIVGTIKKVWIFLKQGWKSLKEAINYLKNPDNQKQPLNIRLLETGKIIMAGVSAVSAIVLSETIEKSLMSVPFFAVEIPFLGSLANMTGLLAGGLIAGIIGAIAINMINKSVEKKQKELNLKAQIDKSNEVLNTQAQLISVNEEKLSNTKSLVESSIANRHSTAQDEIKKSLSNIFSEDEHISKNNDESFDEMDRILKGLLD